MQVSFSLVPKDKSDGQMRKFHQIQTIQENLKLMSWLRKFLPMNEIAVELIDRCHFTQACTSSKL